MKSIEFDQMIIQGMHHLNELTQLDIEWLSISFEKVHAFINHPIPLGLDFNKEDYNNIYNLCFKNEEFNPCMSSTISLLEFIFIPLIYQQQKKGLIKIGPFITNPIDHNKLSDMMVSLNLSLRHHKTLYHFYNSLSLIPSTYTNNLGYIGMNLFGHQISLLKIETYHSNYINSESKISTISNNEQDLIELRYSLERQVRKATKHGDIELLKNAIQTFENNAAFKDRFPNNPLRSTKNLAITLNTILRIAAGDSGLHPIYLHQISEKYAILIEKATTRTMVSQLQSRMLEDYVNTVKLHAYPNVSPLIRKVIDTIQLNLDQPINVSTLAKRFELKPSNLANQFKKETQKTISEFTHELRLKEAVYYLKNSNLSISEISRLVGYSDQNYFTRIFKKYYQTSPSQYVKNINKT